MPLYEFWCKKCDDVFEELKSLSDNTSIPCPVCKADTQRLVSACQGVVIGSMHRPLDCVIGADSEKKWESMSKRKQNRKIKAGE